VQVALLYSVCDSDTQYSCRGARSVGTGAAAALAGLDSDSDSDGSSDAG